MKKLYVAWQTTTNRKWVVVGVLEMDGGLYKFSYTKGSECCPDFRRFGSMNKDVTISEELFPFFANRVLNKSRPEYAKLLDWMNVSDACDPMDMLALTEGKRGTDDIELFACPLPVHGRFRTTFFAHGVRHTHMANQEGLSLVRPGDRVFLMMDVQNPFDDQAVALRTDDPACLLGYLPRYLAADVQHMCKKVCSEDIQVRMLKVNSDAPMAYRFLCQLDAPWPSDFMPCAEPEYQYLE